MCPHSTGNKLLCTTIVILAFMVAGCSTKENSITGPSDSTPGTATIYLNNSQQIIRGFGGQNMPGWSDVGDLTPDQVQKAFGTGAGQIGMSILRIRVPYDSSKFNLEVPTAQLVQSLGVTTIFASPWSPPPSMKSNNNIVGGILNPSSYADYANYLKAFTTYMSSHGVTLYAISLQNEPDVSVTYESCYWNSTQMLNFAKYNAPSIGIKIIVPESYNGNRTISDAILNDPVAAANISIIGVHIYGGGGRTSYPLAASKGKEVWMTEHLVLDTTWGAAQSTAGEIYDCMNADMNAYVWWYIRRYYGPIDENGNVTKRGYAMSQFARFIRPGFYKVDATSEPQQYVYVTAYKNGAKVVIVVLNYNSSMSQTFTIWNGSATTFTPYVTSTYKNCAQESDIIVSGSSFTATLDSSSVTTFVSN